MKESISHKSRTFPVFILGFSLLLGGIFSVFSSAKAEGTPTTFVVSAYYSPLPNQQAYVRGTYEAEKRLQGNGIRGADYTKVYPGMLAAPRTYKFGTKIYIPGLGTGTVHDRGGAIRAYNGFDRIDVWMGRGDEGRRRALQWGMRRVQGKIMPSGAIEDLQYSHIPQAKDMYRFKHGNTSAVLTVGSSSGTLTIGSKGDRVKSLQKILKEKGFFSGPLSGNFGPQTQKAVLAFQIKYKVVKNASQNGAGVYGPLTQKTLRANWDDHKKPENTKVLAHSAPTQNPENSEKTEILSMGDKGDRVKNLQAFLKKEGFFTGIPTGNYGPRTQNAVFKFQKFHTIVAQKSDIGAGQYGPKTQEMVKKLWLKTPQKNSEKTEFLAAQTSEISGKNPTSEFQIIPVGVGLGDKGVAVKRLQIALKTLGFFTEEPNGIFGPKTQKSVLAFQMQQKVLLKNTDRGAGYLGPRTHRMLSLKLEEKRKVLRTDVYFETREVSAQMLLSRRENKKENYISQKETLLSSL